MAKFCSKCGSPLNEGSAFCPQCGAATAPDTKAGKSCRPSGHAAMQQGEQISPNIYLCPDGKYRWVYELNLLKNPTIFLLVWKIFFFIILGIFAFTVIIDAGSTDYWWDGFLDNAKIFGYVFAGMTALVLLGYLGYAAMMGGKYCVMFEMDEKGVNHRQLPKQAKKAQAIAALTVLAGVAAGSLTTVGAGLGASRTEMYTAFDHVRKVKSIPRRGLIKVNERLNHNQVYAAREDFDFVQGFILAHCPQAKRS